VVARRRPTSAIASPAPPHDAVAGLDAVRRVAPEQRREERLSRRYRPRSPDVLVAAIVSSFFYPGIAGSHRRAGLPGHGRRHRRRPPLLAVLRRRGPGRRHWPPDGWPPTPTVGGLDRPHRFVLCRPSRRQRSFVVSRPDRRPAPPRSGLVVDRSREHPHRPTPDGAIRSTVFVTRSPDRPWLGPVDTPSPADELRGSGCPAAALARQ
jgi:hypothetical protein